GAGRADLAADSGHRSVWHRGDFPSQPDGFSAAEPGPARAKFARLALADPVLRRTDSARAKWADADGALPDRAVGGSDGSRLRVRRGDDARAESSRQDLHDNWRVSY